jgi:hypothetical protein
MTGMMGMMSKMMEGDQLNMMMEMMPKCLGMMLQKVPKEKRTEFVLKMVTTLVEQGSAGMSDEEKNDFVAKVIETVKGQGN